MKKKILSLLLALVMVFGVLLPMAAVPETAVTANAATCPIAGATGAGTETDPVVVDNYNELINAMNYSGTLYILAKSFDTSRLNIEGKPLFAPITTKKVLIVDQNLEIKKLDAAESLFKVADGGDFTITADSHRTIKYTYTVVEACHANAKVTLDGAVDLQTTHNDKTDVYSYALRCYTGKTFIDNARLSSAQFANNAATIKNVSVSGNVSLKGTAFTVWPGSIGYLGDKDQTFLACPDFGTSDTYRKELQVRCVGGFHTQSPAMPEGQTTAAEEKVFLGMDKVYEFSTRGNPGWSMDQNYSPYGSLLIIDSSNGIVWSAQDDDVGNFDSNVSLSVNLKDKIKTPGKYKIREVITLKKDGNEVKKLVHEFPVEVVEFNTFLGQSPAMPAGNTEFFLGTISQKSYPVTFYSHSLPQSMIDEGYKSIAILKVYKNDADNTYVYGEKAYCNKGQKISYDLNSLPADIYRLVETIELRDKNNKVVKSAENTFYIDWAPQQDIKEVNITANWQGAVTVPVSATKGVKVTDYRWEKYDGSNWNTFTGTINGGKFRCMVELTAESGYTLASDYIVKIGGIAAKKYTGSLWYVVRDITGYVNFVDIEHSNAPEAGAYPEFDGYDIVQGANTSVKLVEWFKCDKNGNKLSEPLTEDDMFEKDSYYRLEVTVAPAADYEFKNDAAFYINGVSVNYNTSHGSDIPGSITGYKVYNVKDAEGKFELYLYDGNQTGAAKDIIIKDGQYIASDSATPVTTKPSGGYAYYKNGVLTFDGYNNAKAHFVFEEGNLDVYLKGRNRIGAIYNSEYLGEINGLDKRQGNMTISADAKASLTVASNPLDAYCNIYVNALTFNSGKVVSCLANDTYGSALYAEKLFIADGYKAYVGATDDFDASEEWNGIADIKDYENVWLDEDVCRHELFKYEKADATCISEGCKETFEVCEKCYLYVVKEDGTVLTGDEASEFYLNAALPKTDHNYKLHKKQDATCTADGAKYDYYTCDVCDGIFSASKAQISELTFKKDIFIPKLSHKLTAVGANSATCTKDGNIAYWVCGRAECGKFFSEAEATNEITDVTVKATGHSVTKIAAVKATCTKNGTIEHYKCSKCSVIFSDAAATKVITDTTAKATGHTAGNWQVKVAAEVGKKGTEVKKCTTCNAELETRDIPALTPSHTHTTELIKGVAATCTANGIIEHYRCSGCAKLFSDAAATKEIADATVKATGHSAKKVAAVKATCTKNGAVEHYKCSVCSKLFSDAAATNEITDVTVKATGHTAGNWQVKVAAEVGKKGTEVKKCTTCNAELETRDIPALTASHTHTPVLIKGVAATCTANGIVEHYKCSGCAKLFSDAAATKEITDVTVKAPGHTAGNWQIKVAAQVGKKGTEVKKCTTCNAELETRDIPALTPSHTHTPVLVKGVAATCTANGIVEHYKCSGCAKLFSDAAATKEIADATAKATGHSAKKVAAVKATCTKNGSVEHYKCEKCSKLFFDAAATKEITDTTAKATGHSYEWVVTKEAKVGVEGEKANKCKVCGDVKETQKIPALAPDYMLGDVDASGKIDATDARLALRAAVGLETLTDTQKKAADVDKNDTVNATDARTILRAAVGLEKLN